MIDEPIFPQSESVSPQTKGVLPSGIRLGLQGSLDADDMARKMLGVFEPVEARPTDPQEQQEQAVPRDSIFLLGDVSDTSFSIYAHGAKTSGVPFINAFLAVGDGNFTYDNANDKWTLSGVSASLWVYLKIDTDDESAEIRYGALPTPAPTLIIKPLYYIPWDTPHARINYDLIVDFRHSVLVQKSQILPFTNYPVIDNSGANPAVTFSAGSVIWGKLPAMTVSNTGPHTVLDGAYWGIRMTYSPGGTSAAWISSTDIADFTDTDTTVAQWYYKFSVVSGVAIIASVAAVGNWKIPSIFAPETG